MKAGIPWTSLLTLGHRNRAVVLGDALPYQAAHRNDLQEFE